MQIDLPNEHQIKEVKLYDARSLLVYVGKEKVIDMTHYAPGVYFVQVETTVGVQQAKVLCN